MVKYGFFFGLFCIEAITSSRTIVQYNQPHCFQTSINQFCFPWNSNSIFTNSNIIYRGSVIMHVRLYKWKNTLAKNCQRMFAWSTSTSSYSLITHHTNEICFNNALIAFLLTFLFFFLWKSNLLPFSSIWQFRFYCCFFSALFLFL